LAQVSRTAAVFFDVDFTLIYPGPRFQGVGYRESCARHGIDVEESLFASAVAGAAASLDSATPDGLYDAQLYVTYTRRIIELMGGSGTSATLDRVAREIYDEWAEHHHFELYPEVPDVLRSLKARGVRLGLISNSHRCLESFQSHFGLEGLLDVTVSSSDHGFMKPHPQIFKLALDMMDVPAESAAMVGDSVTHDVVGARGAGMRGILIARGATPGHVAGDVTVIRSLDELEDII
jgi:putative hydrolase of the HAD superfamily